MIDRSFPSGDRFAAIPVAMASDARLTAADLRVLIYLLSKTSDWQVVATQVAESINMDRKTVERSLKRLVELGYADAKIKQCEQRSRTKDYLVRASPKNPQSPPSAELDDFGLGADDPTLGHARPNLGQAEDEVRGVAVQGLGRTRPQVGARTPQSLGHPRPITDTETHTDYSYRLLKQETAQEPEPVSPAPSAPPPPPKSAPLTEAEEIAHGIAMGRLLTERLASGAQGPRSAPRRGLITSSNVKTILDGIKEKST